MGLARDRHRRIYAVLSSAVGLVLVLSLARANDLIGETVGKGCGDHRDAVRRSLIIEACHVADVDRCDIANGGIVLLAFAAALNPTLVALRIALLVPVLMYLSDAGQMHATFAVTGHIYPGIELWWLPISWLSTFIVALSAAVAVFKQVSRWLYEHHAG